MAPCSQYLRIRVTKEGPGLVCFSRLGGRGRRDLRPLFHTVSPLRDKGLTERVGTKDAQDQI